MANSVEVIELTRQLVALNTINPPGNEDACARLIGSLLLEAGFDVAYHELAPSRTSVIARRGRHCDRALGQAAKPICLTGHLDTVPLGTASWSIDPFAGEIVEGKLFGRGTTDMKAGIAAMVAAAIGNGKRLDEGPGAVLVLTAGEETGCEGAAQLAELGDALGTAGALVVGEPTSNYPRVGHKGVLWLNAETRGVTAHGSMPELGVNAVLRGAKIVTKLEDFGFNRTPHEILGGPTINVGRMHGGMNINSVPDHAEIGLDIRTIPGMDHRHVVEGLRAYLAPELDEVSSLIDLDPLWTDPHDPWVQRVYGLVAPYLGERPVAKGVPYFSDASILTAALGSPPTIILGPGESRMAHQTDEYCFVDLIKRSVEIYGDILRDWQRG